MPDQTKNLYQELIARLQANSTLTSLVGNKIYSYVPQNTEYPYVRINISSELDGHFDESAQEYTARVQIFSKKHTPAEALDIRELIRNLLDRAEEDLNLEFIQVSGNQQLFQEDDDLTWQGIIDFKINI